MVLSARPVFINSSNPAITPHSSHERSLASFVFLCQLEFFPKKKKKEKLFYTGQVALSQAKLLECRAADIPRKNAVQ